MLFSRGSALRSSAVCYVVALALGGCTGSVGGPDLDCASPESFFANQVWAPTMSKSCARCHNADGLARATRLILRKGSSPEDIAANLEVVRQVAAIEIEGTSLILLKPTAQISHGGGRILTPGGDQHRALERMVQIFRDPGSCNIGGVCEETASIPARVWRLTPSEIERVATVVLGAPPAIGGILSADEQVYGFTNNASALRVSTVMAESVMDLANALADAVVARLGALAPCGGGSLDAERACARSFLEATTPKAFRRPVSADEIDRLLGVFDAGRDGSDYAAGVHLVASAVFQHPSFLYRTEIGEVGPDGKLRLTPYEIASSLSFSLTGGPPDAELTALAADGSLMDGEVRAAQTDRLLASPGARARMATFVSEWLGIADLPSLEKDPNTYPEFTPALRRAMKAETEAYVENVLFDGDGLYSTLLTADYTFMNDDLALLYGVDAPMGPELVPAPLPPGERRGLLTQASVLSKYAHSHESSPVKRGKFIREQILCQPLPTPPPIDITPPERDPTQTTRQRFARHSSDPVCAACHTQIDPIGFGLETYDGIGRFRAEENGVAIDSSGALEGVSPEVDGPFSGGAELADKLAASSKAHACFVTNFYRFTMGRGETLADACYLRNTANTFVESGTSVPALVRHVVSSPMFIERKP